MKVTVIEYFSAGFSDILTSNILSEGFSMLSSVIKDFKYSGHRVSTLLDSRLASFQPPLYADKTLIINSKKEIIKKFSEILKDSEAFLIIAPESDENIQNLITLGEEFGLYVLNSTIDSINTVSNKVKLYKKLKSENLYVPETEYASIDEELITVQEKCEKIVLPVILKPAISVGCQGLSKINKKDELMPGIKKIEDLGATNFLIQKYKKGIHASVSLISNKKRCIPLTLNLQLLALNPPVKASNYLGGAVPFNHKLREEAFSEAKRAVELFDGLNGYVGVDLILSEKGPVIIEINPRLTTSYIGLRKVSIQNVADMMISASLEEDLPDTFETSGYSLFIKERVPVSYQNDTLLTYMYSIEELSSPPFPIDKENYAIWCTKGKNSKEAKLLLQRKRKNLRKMIGRK